MVLLKGYVFSQLLFIHIVILFSGQNNVPYAPISVPLDPSQIFTMLHSMGIFRRSPAQNRFAWGGQNEMVRSKIFPISFHFQVMTSPVLPKKFQMCTKVLRNLRFPPKIFNFLPEQNKLPGIFFNVSLHTQEDFFPSKLQGFQLLL